MTDKYKIINVEKNDTLINILNISLKDLSKKDIKKFLKFKQVEVNGKIESNVNKIINKNSVVKIYFSKRQIAESKLMIIYEDSDLIVIDKPSGLLSVSTSKASDATAFRIVSDYIKKGNKQAKLFVVHRLDKDTSGVLLFAKNEKIKNILQDNWNDLVLKREYFAVVEGEINDSDTIKTYLTNDSFNKIYSTKNEKIGKLAITHYVPIKSKKNRTLLRVNIDTGRKNQIRAHLSEIGHPIIGDKKYGSVDSYGRLALHATRLHLKDPRNNKILKLECNVPKSIEKLID